MDQKSVAVISEVIAKLQGLMGTSAGTSSGPTAASLPEFDANLAKCLQKADTISPQLVKLTSLYQEATNVTKAVLGFSKTCKKYSGEQEEKLKQKIMDIAKNIDSIEKENPDFSDHCKTFREVMQTAFWVFVPAPQFLLKGAIESADFWALKFMKKKNQDHNDWYKLFQIAVKSLQKYVLAEYPTGISFNFHGEDKWNLLLDGKNITAPAQQAPKQAPKSQPPPAPVKKQKKKEMVGLTCTISNFQSEPIVLTADEIQMKHGIFLQNSKDIKMKIEGKFKSLVISHCEDIVLEMKSCLSGVEIINSKRVKVYVRERSPSISADTSESVSIILNQENLQCEVVSFKTSELTVAYTKGDGNESKATSVSAQLVTKWDPNSKQFKTAVYDKFL